MSLYKQGKALVLLPEEILRRLSNFVCIILLPYQKQKLLHTLLL